MRKIRYRQVLRHRCANHGRGTYAQQVQLQKLFWREDNTPTPTIEIVREIHSSLGTWDKLTEWRSWLMEFDKRKGRHAPIKGKYNRIITNTGVRIHPKANYKPIKLCREALKADRWKEQERRTLEFFEREGC
ncbi:hypothetical protein [Bacillus thuringiensis]|uniref:hypothetical protein n=1 Tax=Bacillus thuringiensis TaxID=1428 RepID=UPI000BF36FD1|nr:hypothetical protein [Bacillus thuringiensis]PFA41956.1 hypothetical protein CN416_04185 [Bacillus thuringiensis]